MVQNPITTKEGRQKHIQGIRAICLTFVLLYHFELGGALGGYLGVDMFFVISGFVMTGSITTSLYNDSFSFRKFIQRRYWRLYPVLFTTCVLTLASFYPILDAQEFRLLRKSALFALLGVNNIHLMMSSQDYFAISSHEMPLLHTWSLSLEQQFYFLYPILLLLFQKLEAVRIRPKVYFSTILILFSMILFALGIVISSTYPSSRFYMIFTRFYEFAAGGLLNIMFGREGSPKVGASISKRTRFEQEVMFCAGVLLCFSQTFSVSHITHWNNPPVFSLLGICLLISSPNSVLSRVLLQNPASVGIGEASYTIYLLHWPMFKLFSMVVSCKNTEINLWTLIPLMTIMSFLVFKGIEQTFRSRECRFRTLFFVFQMYFLSVIMIINVSDSDPNSAVEEKAGRFSSDPPKQRIFPVPKRHERFVTQALMQNGIFTESGNTSGIDAMFVGSSFAHQLIEGARMASERRRQKFLLLSREGCRFEVKYLSKFCRGVNESFLKAIVEVKPKRLFILDYWERPFGHSAKEEPSTNTTSGEEQYFEYLDNLYRNLSTHEVNTVIIGGTTPRHDSFRHYKRCVSIRSRVVGKVFKGGVEKSNTYSPNAEAVRVNTIMRKYFETGTHNDTFKFLDLFKIFCPSNTVTCRTEAPHDIPVPADAEIDDHRYILWEDGFHLSRWGSLTVGAALDQFL